MNKIKFKITIKEKSYSFLIKEKYNDDRKIIRYAKAALSKKGISLLETAKNIFLREVDKCPFCLSDSNYELIFKVDMELNSIYVLGVKLVTNSNGWKDYHCKKGRKYCEGSRSNPNSIDFISGSFKVTREEAREFILKRNKSPFYATNHDTEESYFLFQSRSKESHIKKYGVSEGNRRYDSFVCKTREKNNREYLIEKYGTEAYETISKKKSVCTLSFYISKYGEIDGVMKYSERIENNRDVRKKFIEKYGIEKWNESQEKRLKKTSLDYLVQTLGYEEGLKKFTEIRKSYSFTRKDYIEKYGEESLIKSMGNFKPKYSKEAYIFFELLLDELRNSKIFPTDIKWKDSEFFIWDDEYKRIYFYDLYFVLNKRKIIIEYDNVFWHPRGDKNTESNGFTIFGCNITADEKAEYDERKINIAKIKGYCVIKIETDKKNLVRDRWKYDSLIEESINKIKLTIC